MKEDMRRVPGRAKLAITASCAAFGLFAAACQGTPSAAHGGKPGQGNGSAPTAVSAQISITPRNGASSAKPSHGVTVIVAHGTLSTVKVKAGSDRMPGTPQVPRHRITHHAQTDEREFHQRSIASIFGAGASCAQDGRSINQVAENIRKEIVSTKSLALARTGPDIPSVC